MTNPLQSDEVKGIIRGQSEFFRLMGYAAREGCVLSEDEQKKVSELRGMVNQVIEEKVKATLSMSLSEKRIIVDIINNAPITE